MNDVLIIAEAGVNHGGDLECALELVDVASSAGADVIKFQTFRTEDVVTAQAPKAAYQTETTGGGNQADMIRVLELDTDAHRTIKSRCQERGIMFASTPFDLPSVDLLEGLDVPFFKIPSGEINNLPLIKRIAAIGKPIILSTGMSTLDEIQDALDWIGDGPKSSGSLPPVTILHCVTAYPAPIAETNLRAMQTIQEKFGLPVGFSDHSLGVLLPHAATAIGASVIEKHFTLDHTLPGPDHHASLEPSQLRDMVIGIRAISSALGDGIKRPALCERNNLPIVRRSIVAAKAIRRGEIFTEHNLAVKRPGTGLSPAQWDDVIGKRAPRDFAADTPIELTS